MCEPTTLVAVGTMATTAAVKGVSSVQQGNYQAKVDEQNATIAGAQAADALTRGGQEAGRIRAEGSTVAGSALAAAAANGVDTSTGSVSNMFATSHMNAAADAEQVKANAAREAWGYKVQASNAKASAKMSRRSGILGAVSAGFGGVSGALNAYGTFEK